MRVRRAAPTALVAALLGSCSGTDVDTRAPQARELIAALGIAPVAPEAGLLVVEALRPAAPAAQSQAAAIADFDEVVGWGAGIAHVYRTWDSSLVPPGIDELAAQGRYPMLLWNALDIPEVAAGDYDELIREQARSLTESGVPDFLRFRWRMDRLNLREAMQSPQTYVAAWPRARDLFEEVGVHNNASRVWCPTAAGFDRRSDETTFYPGDEQVAWLCADAYPGREVVSLERLMMAYLAWDTTHDKSVMIGEFGIRPTLSDRVYAAWMRQAGDWLADQDAVEAVVYFDLDMNPSAAVQQFTLDRDTRTARAVGDLARDPEVPS